MSRKVKIYTRGGDDGSTALGTGERARKDARRIGVYGTVDELNSAIGLARSLGLAHVLEPEVARIQNDLFTLGADLCYPEGTKSHHGIPTISATHVSDLEGLIDRLSESLPELRHFVLPAGDPTGAALHLARTICRRAEREAVTLAAEEPIGAHVIPYLNRLSDTLFVMARYEIVSRNKAEVEWIPRES